jgi:hypothetical protein
MPWYQFQAQMQQWLASQAQREAEFGWSSGFQREQHEQRQHEFDWSAGFQQQQLWQQAVLEDLRREAETEMANVAAFGRRWKPNVRWM